MGVLTRDPASTAATLARWLRAVAGTADPAVTDVSIPGATGWSNETILFDAAWGEDDRRTRRLVARIAPSGHQVFPDETFLRQHTVMRALSERSDVPMARIHWLETAPRGSTTRSPGGTSSTASRPPTSRRSCRPTCSGSWASHRPGPWRQSASPVGDSGRELA
jgi:hypothetical protein